MAAKYWVSPAWVQQPKQRREANGETAPRLAGRRQTTEMLYTKAVRTAINQIPDATLVGPG